MLGHRGCQDAEHRRSAQAESAIEGALCGSPPSVSSACRRPPTRIRTAWRFCARRSVSRSTANIGQVTSAVSKSCTPAGAHGVGKSSWWPLRCGLLLDCTHSPRSARQLIARRARPWAHKVPQTQPPSPTHHPHSHKPEGADQSELFRVRAPSLAPDRRQLRAAQV